jgi:hypothetical protein
MKNKATIILSSTGTCPLGMRQGYLMATFAGNSSHCNKNKTKQKIEKEKVKMFIFENFIIKYIEDSRDPSGKLLEQISKLIKVATYKISIQIVIIILPTGCK